MRLCQGEVPCKQRLVYIVKKYPLPAQQGDVDLSQ